MKQNVWIFLLFLNFYSFSQITLKQHNFVSIGDTIIEYYTRFPKVNIDIGEAGENKTWDFSNLNTSKRDTIQFVDPKKTPFAEDFPNANIALYSNNIYEAWMFMNNSNSELKTIGSGVFVNNKKRIENRNVTTIRYPFNYLDTSNNKKEEETILLKTKKGTDSIKRKRVFKHNTTVDAWGDIILPTGTFLSLRLKHEVNVIDYFYKKRKKEWHLLGKLKGSSNILYQWWTDDKETKHPVAQVVMDESHKKPIIIKFLPAIPFSEIMGKKGNNKLIVYPNPATEKIFINLKQETESYITIYSINGKIIRNIKTKSYKTEIAINELPVGIFFIINRNKRGVVLGKSKFIKVK
ncbi:T9SS type A sorting domain-containing protein [Tenacibaculum sp. M341]|uniref:T9SS type A sorting domain-containing protein n=1 Tax=Tenacibaculum sp. M341 TaxID=2530339 RepID=UPI00104BB806|nr:T9SS type A sorting domain-containing protein [Tenacibaculum sp. M341]TCI94299.1 T9SS type A sorting domain-containing protein [Tenacibaculum sp. M341]